MTEQSTSWKRYLTRHAQLHRMCNDNRAYLNACETKSDAIRLYKQTIDWALEEQYPSMEFFRKEMSQQQEDGLYIDQTFDGEMFADHQCYVFHNCKGRIKVNFNKEKVISPILYFANGCDITVEGVEFNTRHQMPFAIYIFGENKVNCIEHGNVTYSIKKQAVKPIKQA